MNHQKKISAKTKNIMIPGTPKEYSALQVKEIRARNNCSQKIFAQILNVNLNTLRSWELGRRKPTSSAMRLLELIENNLYQPFINH